MENEAQNTPTLETQAAPQEAAKPSAQTPELPKQKPWVVIGLTLLVLLLLGTTGFFAYQNHQLKKQVGKTQPSSIPTDYIPTPTTVTLKLTPSPVQTKPPEGWVKHAVEKLLNISFYTPKDYEINSEKTDSGTWSVNVVFDNGMKLTLCVGCQLTQSIQLCGMQNEFCQEVSRYTLPNNGHIIVNNKKGTDKFAEITGVVYKKTGEDIAVHIGKEDEDKLSEELIETIILILSSITELRD